MIKLLGIDDSGQLGESLRHKVMHCDVLCGGERHLGFFPDYKGETYVIKGKLKELTQFLESKNGSSIVVLASGDPLFYGIGGYLTKKLGPEKLEIEPAISSMQMAFARAKLSWQEASLVSVHGKPLSNLDQPCQESKIIGVFTDASNSPQAIADYVAQNKLGQFDCWVCQNLGGDDEALWHGDLMAAKNQKFSDLNVVILQRREGDLEKFESQKLPLFGLDDNLFIYRAPSRGLITKKEVRVVSLSQMNLKADSVVWDIGAGSGSVSVEAARLCPQGQVFAIEKNKLDFENISKNFERFGVANATAANGLAPEGIPSDWPSPDAVFIGGSSGSMEELVAEIAARQVSGGRLVINAITLESQAKALAALKKVQYEISVQQVNVSRSKPLLDMIRFEALNPINIYTGIKP